MAGSLNKAILIGNLGRDPEIRHTADGKEIASFSVATSETWKDRTTGEKKEKTEWHRVVVFSEGLVSVVKNYAKKGTRVYLEGILQTRKWVDNLGHEKYTTEIVLQNFNSQFILLDSKGVGIQTSDTVVPKNTVTNFDHSDLDDEIPF
ncbi:MULTISPECIES: single-stranded DNA-binding protein [Rickettsieae]|uniref:single-stranded DNA-binding protein n=1 Tax=Rickettsieae TaxID=33988 RepID=UPI000B9B16AD|nr:single-stranded DNA-binding protein [Rickettsia endosymbiont of Culicoides newsteadi]MDN3030079.1 single-stranded DNA-binding protein [Candidatus Tisiphia sp.]OZG31888.1 single-stranded DNA-binding protein [Rickettsia endosymbiont of Culicoides newsteadi]